MVTVAIDTEEDNWGFFEESGFTTKNISHLVELQDLFDEYGARPSYLVNYAPLVDGAAVDVLGRLAASETVEIGAHCHPWNTPPSTGDGIGNSMMCTLSVDENRAKIRHILQAHTSELGVRPTTFRAGRWALGPSVAQALVQERIAVDCSVSPFLDWSHQRGSDYRDAPHRPYRMLPSAPLIPNDDGPLIEIPTTVGFTRGNHLTRQRLREALSRGPLRRLGAVGILDRLGVLSRRWLSPETSTGEELVRLSHACAATGEPVLGFTFHSCALLPGATPFVRDEHDKRRFLHAITRFLQHCRAQGYEFLTLGDVGRRFFGDLQPTAQCDSEASLP